MKWFKKQAKKVEEITQDCPEIYSDLELPYIFDTRNTVFNYDKIILPEADDYKWAYRIEINENKTAKIYLYTYPFVIRNDILDTYIKEIKIKSCKICRLNGKIKIEFEQLEQ